jgi:hypothetical protein
MVELMGNIFKKIFIGASGSFFGGLGVILFIKVVLVGWFNWDFLKDTIRVLESLISIR